MSTAELLTQMAKALATRDATDAWLASITAAELTEVWSACPDARALLRLAAPAVDSKALVRVACACLRFTLDQKKGHHRVRNAVKLLEQWSQGAAEWRDVEHAVSKTTERGDDLGDLGDALTAVMQLPTDPSRAQDVVAALSLALSNEDTVFAAGNAPPRKTRVVALAQLADVVRATLPCPSLG